MAVIKDNFKSVLENRPAPIKRNSGTVLNVLEHKGYGFIAGVDSGTYFFLRRNLRPNKEGRMPFPPIGTRVTFLIAPVTRLNSKGLKARDEAIDIEVL